MKLRELLCACKGAVAADHYKSVDSELLDVLVGLRLSFRSAEFIASGGLEYRSSALDGVAHALGGQFLYISVDETFIAAVYAENFPARIDRRPCDGSYAGVHSGGVASGCQDSYGIYVHIAFSIFDLQIYQKFQNSFYARE